MGEREDEFARRVFEIETRGYTVVPGALRESECEAACAALRRVLEAEEDPEGTILGPGDGWAYHLMNKARVFERV